MSRTLQWDAAALGNVAALFERHADSRLAAAVDAVLTALEEGIDQPRTVSVAGQPLQVPAEFRYRPLHTAPGGAVTLAPEEGDGTSRLPTWVIVFAPGSTPEAVRIAYAGPRPTSTPEPSTSPAALPAEGARIPTSGR